MPLRRAQTDLFSAAEGELSLNANSVSGDITVSFGG